MKILKEIRESPFKYPVKKYYLGKIKYGTPYFMPYNFDSTIISIRKLIPKTLFEREEYSKRYPYLKVKNNNIFKNLPMVKRNRYKIIKFLKNYYFISIGYPFSIKTNELGWKDKWNSPRHEWNPAFYIFFFKWQFHICWESPDRQELYYEQILWWLKYCDKDIIKAENTWGWTSEGISTWNNNYLK